MAEPRYIESSPGARAKLAGVCLACFLLGLACERWVAAWVERIRTLPTCESLPWIRLELAVAVLACWLVAWTAFHRGRAIRRFGQTPVPGTWVWTRTKVRTGAPAALAANGLFALGALLLVAPVVIIVWQKLYLIFCVSQSCGC